uniref:Uncharacterized protein n=1 Tax=Anguilla anguilla TaxID=7936 RepID=A0A0E9X6V8_ANGAN
MRISIAHFRVITQGTFRLFGSPAVVFVPVQLLSLLALHTVFGCRPFWRLRGGLGLLWLGLLPLFPHLTC